MVAWSTTAKAGTTLSGSDLIATNTQAGFPGGGGLGDTAITGKKCFSIVTSGAASLSAAGVASASFAYGTDWLGGTTQSISYFGDSYVYTNNTSVANWDTFADGQVVMHAVDRTNNRWWAKVGASGLWNNSPTADPATNVGGRAISAITGSIYPAYYSETLGASVELLATAAAQGTMPSGFTAYDPATSGGIVGIASITFDALTAAATSKLALKATASAMLGALATTSNGKVAIRAAAAPSLGALTASATGKVAIKAAAAQTLGDLSASAFAKVAIKANATATLGNLTMVGTSVIGSTPLVADMNAVLGSLTSAVTAALAIRASAEINLAGLSSSATASIRVSALLTATLGDLSMEAMATIAFPDLPQTLAVWVTAPDGYRFDQIEG